MWRSIPLTLFWFTYFGSLGIFYPYFSLYLRENAGLSGTQLGLVLAISPMIGMIAQPLWGQMADRTGARGRLLALLNVGHGVRLSLARHGARLFVDRHRDGGAGAGRHRGVSADDFGQSGDFARRRDVMRLAVSESGAPSVFCSGACVLPRSSNIFGRLDALAAAATSVAQPGLELMFPITAALVFISAVIAWFLPKKGAVALRAARGDWRELLNNRAFLRFLMFSLLAHFLMHGPMWLFPLFVRSRGGDVDTIRSMWILMLSIEIPLVLLTGSGLKRLGARGLLTIGVIVGGMRWLLCALVSDPLILFGVQALHGITVVGLNLGSPLYLDVVAPEKLRSTAQGILSMVSAGIAGIASNTTSGWLVDRAGTDLLYLICGVGCVTLGVLSRWILPLARRRDETIDDLALTSETLT